MWDAWNRVLAELRATPTKLGIADASPEAPNRESMWVRRPTGRRIATAVGADRFRDHRLPCRLTYSLHARDPTSHRWTERHLPETRGDLCKERFSVLRILPQEVLRHEEVLTGKRCGNRRRRLHCPFRKHIGVRRVREEFRPQ